jgi:hypothetical protein
MSFSNPKFIKNRVLKTEIYQQGAPEAQNLRISDLFKEKFMNNRFLKPEP